MPSTRLLTAHFCKGKSTADPDSIPDTPSLPRLADARPPKRLHLLRWGVHGNTSRFPSLPHPWKCLASSIERVLSPAGTIKQNKTLQKKKGSLISSDVLVLSSAFVFLFCLQQAELERDEQDWLRCKRHRLSNHQVRPQFLSAT